MQLEDKSLSIVQAFVIITAVPARATKQPLVPEATRLDIMDTDKRGKLHVVSPREVADSLSDARTSRTCER
jgi:hypothetical protein